MVNCYNDMVIVTVLLLPIPRIPDDWNILFMWQHGHDYYSL